MMGRVVAFDMLVNNCDRLPAIWSVGGNPGNVMFRKDDSSLISIDNMPTCMGRKADNAMVTDYLNKVRATSIAVLSQPNVVHPDFAKIRSFLRDGCSGHGWLGLFIDVGDAGVCEIQHGFVEAVTTIVTGAGMNDSEPLSRDLLVEMEQQLSPNLCGDTHDEVGECAFEGVEPNFMADVVRAFTEAHAIATSGHTGRL